jgi:tetratricopeptide (TPR) repeat protein
VYSLGAILYELLTGAKAQRIGSTSQAEVERAVCRTAIPPPSSAVPEATPGAARLRRQLSGDLDNIVLMAMRKEPERRYSSVEQFAADVRRYLEGQPVAARKDSAGYRTGKFIRRRRLGLSAAVLSIVSLLLGTILAISQARQAESARRVAEGQRRAAEVARHEAEREHATARRERDSAMAERARAEREAALARTEAHRAEQRLTDLVGLANHSLFDIHSQIERLPGATEARRQIVNTTLQYLEELSKDARNDERLSMAVGSAYLKLGAIQGHPFGPSLRDYPGALKSYRAAEAFIGPVRHAHPDNPEALRSWVDIQQQTGQVLTVSGHPADAVARLEAALPDAVTLGRLRPDSLDMARAESSLFGTLANAQRATDAAGALIWARKYVDSSAKLAARFPDRESALEQLASAHASAGAALVALADLKAAVSEFEQCAALRERLSAAHPDDAVHRRGLMLAYGHTAELLGTPFIANLGDPEGARKYYAKALRIAELSAAADPKDRTAQYDLAAVLLRLGVLDVPPSGLADSLETLRKSLAIQESLMQDSSAGVPSKQDYGLVQEYMGHRLRDLGRLPEAIAAYRRSLGNADSILAANPANRAAHSQAMAASRGIVVALAMSGDRAGALAESRHSIERAEAAVSIGSDKNLLIYYLAQSRIALGKAYCIFARAESTSPARREEDWRAARTSADRALTELTAIPNAAQNRVFAPAIADARALIDECDAHTR